MGVADVQVMPIARTEPPSVIFSGKNESWLWKEMIFVWLEN
jgi:hypothetical protein